MRTYAIGVIGAVLLSAVLASTVQADDDCNAVMAMLSSAQSDVWSQLDTIDTLDAAIQSSSWDPVSDAWMIGAMNGAVADLVGYLNAEAVASARAHEAHCY